ncbi:DUF3667 domain-containing protein [Massilia litorea]|uniref:DUF3667 domain-containing protein n=1 Tax=Massilia litorea TaxID=2769491 RepID=A0A7L9U816_9BURK|nr:DUF3667 domain-containing protein [Massilia litorea]QOL51174.1 DUF3667 domain-containing protein [Massilia litorea]
MKHDLQLDHAIHCPNCGTSIAGAFCQGCGQPAHLHVPSAREFLHEFIAHYVALEGKLWKSVALLLFRPGRLTRDYIEGKRVRYVEPLRLYLTFSIIFFAIFKLSGNHFGNGVTQAPAEQRVEASAPASPGAAEGKTAVLVPKDDDLDEAATAAGKKEKKKHASLIELDDGDDRWVQKKAAAIHPALGKKVEHFSSLAPEQRNASMQRSFSSYAPYAIFALMPVFAALLKLLYLGSGRRYGEHLLFALHTNAFAFLMLSLLLVLPDAIPLLGTGLMVWLVFYLPTAMRKVYGGGRAMTALRWIVLMTMHLFCIVLAMVGAAALAVIA